MRALVISPLFPPVADPEAFCGGKFVQGLIDSDIQPSVIYCHNVRGGRRHDTSSRWTALEPLSIDIPNPKASIAARCWLGLKYQTTEWAAWTASAVSKARALGHQRSFDVLISRSVPWHAHVAGFWIASALRIPWLANLSDPWDASAFIHGKSAQANWKEGRNSRRWAARVLARADILTFPCERLRDYCLRDSPRQAGVHVIPHIGGVGVSSAEPKEFVIVHAGNLGLHDATGRNARPVLEGLAAFFNARPSAKSRTRLMFVGPADPAAMEHVEKLGLSGVVTSVGQVTYEESLEHIAQATVCLLVEGDFIEGIFLPSKLCDYIVARKPVLALSPAVGTVNDLAREGGILRVSPNDSNGVAEAFSRLFDAFIRQELAAYAPPESMVRRYEAENVMEQFRRILHNHVQHV